MAVQHIIYAYVEFLRISCLEINIASYIKSDIVRHTVIVGAGKIVDDDSLPNGVNAGYSPAETVSQ